MLPILGLQIFLAVKGINQTKHFTRIGLVIQTVDAQIVS